MSATAASQTVFSIGYDFHAGNGTAGSGTDNGNVFGIINYKDTTHGRDQAFTYDALNRLISAQNAGSIVQPWFSITKPNTGATIAATIPGATCCRKISPSAALGVDG